MQIGYTTFNIINLIKKFPIGVIHNADLGTTGSESEHVLLLNVMYPTTIILVKHLTENESKPFKLLIWSLNAKLIL